jgi:DNA-binding transcriptional MerR regulator/methylmalonyl-CoA mutase cobalamin-binding subunit
MPHDPDRPKAKHPIRVVTARTGLSPDVLRVWERRHGVVTPARSEGGQRLYSDADVELLTLLRQATAAGRTISQVAGLPAGELRALIAGDLAAQARGGQAGAERALADAYLAAAWAAASEMAPGRLENVLRRAFFALGGRTTMESVLAGVLHRVGDAWQSGQLTPAHEHVASRIVRRFLDWLALEFAAQDGAPLVAVGTPAGERHEFGSLLAGATAAAEGWRVLVMGSDLPADDIAHAARQSQARVVALSVVYVNGLGQAAEQVGALRRALGAGVALVVGGRAAREIEPLIRGSGVQVLPSLDDFRAFLAARPEAPRSTALRAP